MQRNKFTYKTFFIFILSTIICLALSLALDGTKMLSAPFYLSLIYLKFSPLLSTLAFLIGFLWEFNLIDFYSGIICAFIVLFTRIIYSKRKKNFGAEYILISILSILGFAFLKTERPLAYYLICAGISVSLVYIFIPATKLLFIKKFDFKATTTELYCLAVFAVVFEFGLTMAFGNELVKGLNLYILLFSVFALERGKATFVSLVLSIAPSLYFQNLYPISIYLLLTTSAIILSKTSKILSAFSMLAVDLFITFFIDYNNTFYYTDLIFSIAPIIIFLFTPPFVINSTKEKLTAINSRYLSKYAVNRVRSTISSKLYGISNVFKEMENSFDKLKYLVSTDTDLLSRMADEVVINVCENCPQYPRCLEQKQPDRKELIKMISVGVAKNKISLVDLTKRFTEKCGYVNGIIYEINGLITQYREKVKESEEALTGKELIKMQSAGVADVLKNMAFDFSKSLDYFSKTEKLIADGLKKRGIIYNEVTCFGSDDNLEINMVIKNDFITNGKLLKAVNETLGYENSIVLKTAVSSTISAITIKPAPMLDAAFGIARQTKNGSTVSGDTHSLTKIDEGKFLIALSDGMGSGLRAENTSTTAITLIESFYKAGLKSDLILSMVNKILALNTDDNFSAMDILTVNLFNLTADFIKIGAPFSFILTDDNIKIIEGSSLPLGILDDLTPTGCSTTLTEGATVIMLTDGISDAFGSSTDLIDYLRTLDNKNPQLIADNILTKALNADKSYAKDDMSVLAVRIFKKVS